MNAVNSSSEIELAGILIINHIIHMFLIKIDNLAVHLPSSVQNIGEAIAFLVMYYYVLHLNYPIALKFVYLVFKALFEIQCSSRV